MAATRSRHASSSFRPLRIESLEHRAMLAGAAGDWMAWPQADGGATGADRLAVASNGSVAIGALDTVPDAPIDLGEVDYLATTVEPRADADPWYRLTASHDGILSVQARGYFGPGLPAFLVPQIVLYERADNGDLREVADGTGRVDFASAVRGREYYVHLPDAATASVPISLTIGNLVTVNPLGRSAWVHSSERVIRVEFSAGAKAAGPRAEFPHELRILALKYSFDPDEISDFSVDADQVYLSGSDGDDALEIHHEIASVGFSSAEFRFA